MAGDSLFADTRIVQESNGGLLVSIPAEVADRYSIEKGDKVSWSDEPDADSPTFDPPEDG